MSHDPELTTRLEYAVRIAQEAGTLAMRYFQTDALTLGAERKHDRSIVTKADREAEMLLLERIAERYPDDAVIGEEHGERTGRSGWTWILDPIDGTQAFARGVPLFGTLVAVEREDRPVIGVIGLPALGEMVFAGEGLGCHWLRSMTPAADGTWKGPPPQRCRVSDTDRPGDALFCTTWMQSYKERGCVELFGQLVDATGIFRGWGDCYGYALIATGRAEVMVDPVLAVWDAAALPVIIDEAGGRYTCFAGKRDIRAGSGVATNGLLHEAILNLTKPFSSATS